MSTEALMVDLYQIATLFAHKEADPERMKHRVQMSFFSRRVPTNRNYIMFAGLRSIVEHMKQFDHGTIAEMLWTLSQHPMFSSILAQQADIFAGLDFNDYKLTAMKEGTLVFAGAGTRTDGSPFEINGKPVNVYEPYMQVETSFLLSKLIETPWLSYINYMSMVASKAARVVSVAQNKPVLEFGQRRTHPLAAIDAAYAAYIAGCSATSNVAAFAKYRIPAIGTMDHFAVMASEKEGEDKSLSELKFFEAFTRVFPDSATLLVDTYNTGFGIKNAATLGDRLRGIRIDSNVSVQSVRAARELLNNNGCPNAKIFVSDGLNEQKVQELAPYVDGFGVGENITCSPDSATGVGAVGKLTVNGYGKDTIKVSLCGGKMTLPGPVQVWRQKDFDLIALLDEKADGEPLLSAVDKNHLPSIEDSRNFAKSQMSWLPEEFKNVNGNFYSRRIVVSDKFAELTTKLANES